MTNNDARIVQLETALMIIKAVHSDICNDITMNKNRQISLNRLIFF